MNLNQVTIYTDKPVETAEFFQNLARMGGICIMSFPFDAFGEFALHRPAVWRGVIQRLQITEARVGL